MAQRKTEPEPGLVAQFKITGAGVVHDKDGHQLTYEDGTPTPAAGKNTTKKGTK